MSDLIALVLASLPILAVVGLIVETFRAGTSPRPDPAPDLRYRAYGA
jgi:hypothetical protein